MTCAVVRFARRKASWELPDAASIRDVEFKTREGEVDLRPSVYDIDDSDLTKAFAEHAAAAPIDPPGSALGVDLAGLEMTLDPTAGNDRFAFTRAHHREIKLESVEQLDTLIDLARVEREKRSRPVLKANVYKYVTECLQAGDPERSDLAGSAAARHWLRGVLKKVSGAK